MIISSFKFDLYSFYHHRHQKCLLVYLQLKANTRLLTNSEGDEFCFEAPLALWSRWRALEDSPSIWKLQPLQLKCSSWCRRPDRERMSLSVEHVLIQTDQLRFVREQQEQVLQSLSEEEALHLVHGAGIDHVTYIPYGRVASAGDLGPQAQQTFVCKKCYNTSCIMSTLHQKAC